MELRVTEVEALDNHILRLHLSDGGYVVRDLSKFLISAKEKQLKENKDLFRRVFLSEGGIAWSNGVAIDADTLVWALTSPKY